MTEREGKVIENYIMEAQVYQVEFYQELLDHILSSYENRTNPKQTIEEHLEQVVSPMFGGIKGIEKMAKEQGKFLSSKIYKEGWKIFYNLFTTPSGLLKTLSILGLFYLLQTVMGYDILMELGTPLIILPFIVAGIAQWRFKRKCKIANLPYKSSLVNTAVFGISTLAIAFLQGLPDILSRIIFGDRFNVLVYLSKFEFLTLPLTLVLALYAFVSFTLIRKNIRIKHTFI